MSSFKSECKIYSVETVTTEWLSSTLKSPVESFTSSRIGTGQVSWTFRIALIYSSSSLAVSGPSSVILKIPSSDPSSRHAGLSLGVYEKEVRFYQELAPALSSLNSLATCYHASWDPSDGNFVLLLADIGTNTGNDISGATIEQARLAVTELGKIQGALLRDQRLLEANWLGRQSGVNQALMEALFAGFVERYKERMKPEHLQLCSRLVGCFDAWQSKLSNMSERKGLVHGDYRLDNLLFRPGGSTVVDWQTVFVGPVLSDLAYFVGGSLRTQDRRQYLTELIELYVAALGHGTAMTREHVAKGLREQSFFGVVMCIVSPMMVERTERGDEMFMVTIERHCTAVLDLLALDLLPDAEMKVPLKPKPEDELPHTPGTEDLWNESWYFDLVDEASGLGVYVRLGRYPNLKGTWYNAVITHPEKGLLTITDYECPHPNEDLVIQTKRFTAKHEATVPLQEYKVSIKGTAEQFLDPAAVLQGEKGKDARVDLDITWLTDGTPYAWRMTTRYEIPCRASGKLMLNGEEIYIKDAVAQRDHSHGVRDWWGADWMWCAFHLHDKTRIHGADLRIPKLGRLSVGYIQRHDMPITELIKCHSEEVMAENGLPASARVTLEYGDANVLIVDVKPVGHGPLRLVAPDGRVANFTRCWAQLECGDGRTGVGWIEWNHNLKKT